MKKISIRTAILLPLIILLMVMLITFTIVMNNSYSKISNEQASKIISSMTETVDNKITTLLSEPMFISQLYANLIMDQGLFDDKDFRNIETTALSLTKQVHSALPQITTLGYGNENKEFVGIRANEDDTYTLMVKDNLTNGLLEIYQGETRNTGIVVSYDNYDPRTRPWYAPVRSNPVSQWSEIYMNQDEVKSATISSLVPIFSDKDKQVFEGVVCIDISLTGINDYLKQMAKDKQVLIYLVDRHGHIISHSTEENVYVDNGGVVDFLHASNSSNPLISSSYISMYEFKENTIQNISIDHHNYFSLVRNVEDYIDEGWKIVVVVDENFLVGSIQDKFKMMNFIFVLLIILTMILAVIIISLFISSVTRISKQMKETTFDDLDDLKLIPGKFSFKETDELTISYLEMIDHLKEALNRLEIREEENRILLENTDALIFSILPDGQMVSFNTRMIESTGLSGEEIYKTNFIDLFDLEESKNLWRTRLKQLMDSKMPIRSTYEFIHRTEGRTIFDCRLVPFFDQDRNINLIIGLFINIVDLVQAQESLAEMMKNENERLDQLVNKKTQELEDAVQELIKKETLASLGGMVSGVSHEINTPLGIAISSVSYLSSLIDKYYEKILRGNITKEGFKEFIANMKESITMTEDSLNRSKILIDSFKEISTVTTKQSKSNFNVLTYIEMTVLSMQHELKQKHHQVKIHCNDTIYINGNISNFAQIISNLIKNSVTHGFINKENGLIEIKVADYKDYMLIHYEDNGVGIDDANLQRIFDPFYTTNRAFGGSGLGLSVVHNIVYSEYKGEIAVYNKKPTGIIFEIKLMN